MRGLPDSECILYGSETFSGAGMIVDLRGTGKETV